jgi:hypothetical protein
MTGRGVAAVVLWLLAGGCDPAIPTSAPMLLPGEHRFGTVVHGQKVEHTWLLSAAVPRPFQVKYVRVPCSCAFPSLVATAPGGARRAVDFDFRVPFRVAAGERLELSLVFDSDKRLAKDWEENFQTVVFTDLPEQPEVQFKFQAQVRVPLLLNPGPEVDLGGLNEHQTAATLVTLSPRDGQRFKVLDVVRLVFDEQTRKDRECPLDGLTYKQTVGDDGEYRYLFESPPGRTYEENGRFSRRVGFKTDLPGNYRLEIQFRALRIPAITFEPLGSMSFGRVTPGQTAEQRVSMHQNVPGELFTAEVDRVEVTVEDKPAEAVGHFELRLEPIPAIRVVRLIARYVKPFEGRYFRGKIHLKTSLPDTPTLYVDMVGFHDR